MTLTAIIIDIILLVILIIIAFYVYDNSWQNDTRNAIITVCIGLLVLGSIVAGELWYFNNTESGKRAIKTQESNFSGGIEREIRVYDINGNIIQDFKGKFDVEYDDDRILFDDENGNRHVIYYPTGTVIIDEIEKEE